MKLTVKLCLLFFSLCTFSQKDSISKENIKSKIEIFILENKLDSVTFYLNKIEKDTDTNLYNKLINREQVSYVDFYKFVSNLGNKSSINYDKVSNFINSYLEEPEDSKKINLDYVEIKWSQITKLRDEVSLDKASVEQKKNENYINKFNASDKDVLIAKTKITTHPIVMYLIKKDVKKGKELSLKSLENARKLNDKYLEIAFLYHLSDFLLLERNLEEYIKVSEESLEIEKELPKKSAYYHAVVEHLIDAYIFKGGNYERIFNLIDILNADADTTLYTYTLYIKLINRSEDDLSIRNEIFKKFKVEDMPSLVDEFQKLSKNLNTNDLNKLYKASSKILEKEGFFEKAMEYKTKEVELTKKIYSEELSNSLANFNIEQAVKAKEKEVEYEKEKNKLYAIIAFLAIIFLVISLFVILKIKKQSKELSEKNIIINNALNEKELLIKEVHHRVKNNFQVITSLLEFQSEEIEDEKAIKLFNDGKNRVKSMALIHQKLYKNQGDFIDFKDYIISLLNEISFVHQSEKEVVKVIKVENIFFDVETAIPLGLIINEIITNTCKYAFKNSKNEINKISIEIEKQKDASYKLIIEDNGVGIPKDFNIETSKSIGLKLVKRLIKQLHGSFVLIRNPGTRFELTFKDSSIRNQIE
ncbi:hypothetical protein LPB03_08290 [Polaribacter vadi]|uniref:Histidine kinase domain-containing protein n=1 Tax=Polaribacter vadi TaxID=1774273 RepID=A0A1B8U2P1_9FLAO|nr:sensor histidine kinase [Polaribacter vadi]AOW17463.1 hypothetical protein LPB03_08290 [Polaribacter vadi]OBY66154.1 hypothetical protein LPB3_01675 [Polaribacter vadi]